MDALDEQLAKDEGIKAEQPVAGKVRRVVKQKCTTCGGTGVREQLPTPFGVKDIPCTNCVRGVKSVVTWIDPPAQPAESPAQMTTWQTTAWQPTTTAPAGKPSTAVIFANPAELPTVMPMASVPLGQIWVLSADGELTKLGTGNGEEWH